MFIMNSIKKRDCILKCPTETMKIRETILLLESEDNGNGGAFCFCIERGPVVVTTCSFL